MNDDITARGRKNYSMILQRLASVGQANIADGLGLNESTVSRMKDGDIERFAKMLALLGLKVVPLSMQCYPTDQINAIFTLAKARMKSMDSPDLLSLEAE